MEEQEGWKKHRVLYLPIFHPSNPSENQKRKFNVETCLNPAREGLWSYLLKGCSRFAIGKSTRPPDS